VFLRREKDAWVSFEKERAAREAAEGDLAKECEISADLRQKCSALAAEAREARNKVAPWRRGSGPSRKSPRRRRRRLRGTRVKSLGLKLCSPKKTSP